MLPSESKGFSIKSVSLELVDGKDVRSGHEGAEGSAFTPGANAVSQQRVVKATVRAMGGEPNASVAEIRAGAGEEGENRAGEGTRGYGRGDIDARGGAEGDEEGTTRGEVVAPLRGGGRRGVSGAGAALSNG